MSEFDRKKHWETIYESKQLNEVSWYQPKPETSLQLILNSKPEKDAAIIDIGGGDSFLVDNLLDLGFSNVTVLDISEKAIMRAQNRLGDSAEKAKWVVSDILDFDPKIKYDIWHDRAAFHFLTEAYDIEKYVQLSSTSVTTEGSLIIGTFAIDGPTKCSGIEITQYSAESLKQRFSEHFEQKEILELSHPTPFGTEQDFVFSRFKKK